MNIYLQALGFSNMDSEGEAKFIKAGIRGCTEEGFVLSNNALKRGVIVLRISKSCGLYIFGRYENGSFIYEYYFPFVIGRTRCDNDEITIERHLDKESYAVVCDESKTGVTLIFYLQNVMDYLDYICDEKGLNQKDYDIDSRSYVYKIPIKNKMVSLTALSLGGIIMLPTRNNKSDSVRMKKEKDDRQRLIQAAKKGDESAIESLTIEDIDTYNELSHRIVKEDVFSIVDSSFMPCGVECDQYQVVGEILELSEEINHYTKEKIYIMVIECNDLNMTVAINQAHLLGEPAVGRRFKGQIWLQGSVKFNN